MPASHYSLQKSGWSCHFHLSHIWFQFCPQMTLYHQWHQAMKSHLCLVDDKAVFCLILCTLLDTDKTINIYYNWKLYILSSFDSFLMLTGLSKDMLVLWFPRLLLDLASNFLLCMRLWPKPRNLIISFVICPCHLKYRFVSEIINKQNSFDFLSPINNC